MLIAIVEEPIHSRPCLRGEYASSPSFDLGSFNSLALGFSSGSGISNTILLFTIFNIFFSFNYRFNGCLILLFFLCIMFLIVVYGHMGHENYGLFPQFVTFFVWKVSLNKFFDRSTPSMRKGRNGNGGIAKES